MTDRLPNIVIRADENLLDFISAMECVCPQLWRHERSNTSGIKDEFHLSIHPAEVSDHIGLFAQLMLNVAKNRIDVEIRADKWSDGRLPKYETYKKAAQDILKPLFSAYRKKYGKCSLRIQSKKALEIKVPERTNYFLMQFINSANKQALHSLDWIKFYHFIHAAHVGQTRLTRSELIEILSEQGFISEKANSLSDVYEHGRSLLANKIIPSYLYPPPEYG